MDNKDNAPKEKPDEKGAMARANAAAEAAGLKDSDVRAAFDASKAPSHPTEDLQLRVARLEEAVFGGLNAHFGGKIAALNPPDDEAEED